MRQAQSWPNSILAILIAIALTGVSHPSHARLPTDTEIRAYLNDACIVADEPYYQPQPDNGQVDKGFALSGVVVSKLAFTLLNGAFKLTAKALRNKSSHKDMYFVSAYDFDMYRAVLEDSPQFRLNNQLGCVTVVAAKFASAGTDCTQHYQARTLPADVRRDENLYAKATREDASIENVLQRANVCVDGSARSVFESRISLSEDETAFRLESAGLWVDSLLSTDSRRAKRSIIYTVDIAEPGQSGSSVGLAVASVPIGTVQAGLDVGEDELSAQSDWTKVPRMSAAAYSAYQRDTAIHQDVFAEIMALERSLMRNRRLREGLEKRLPDASEQVAHVVAQEVAKLDFKILHMDALLDARRAEYRDLPETDRYYMPVTIEVGVIESRSEKRALGTLANFLDEHSKTLASIVIENEGFQRSIDSPDPDDDDSALETARAAYFDALVALEETGNDNVEDSTAADTAFMEARKSYNHARRAAGIPEID